MMAVAMVSIALQRNLFASVVLFSVYSFLMATVLVALDAVDVGMTEAAVGAVSTVLLVGTLYLVRKEEMKPLHKPVLPLVVALVTVGVLAYGTLGLPAFSDPDAPIHQHVAPRYLEDGPRETGVANIVIAVLASYRSYDTLGEVIVIFTAGVGVIALLRRRGTKEKER